MSSPPEGKVGTKAGHLPAVKAGGMRIVQKHPHSPTVFISGVIARVAHQKPQASTDKHPSPRTQHIQQPCK
ncbi:unnamed protein product [Nyctereutes procyonoides]|uniref:(raccoon dog) hypothetical protein n=1 Tax=Nyctereutes procyonoides TaxID=34880 RepID=A0A811XU14_NYCPR|nr:unnamed protein product [Nyctereutes procyonoides]